MNCEHEIHQPVEIELVEFISSDLGATGVRR